jgi:hypothetical protein
MILLKKVGNYEIHSEMIEKCTTSWADSCLMVGFFWINNKCC